MKNLFKQIQVTMLFGLMSLFGGLISHLALTDIYHGEANTSLEWSFLRISALVFLVFIGLAMSTMRKMLREMT